MRLRFRILWLLLSSFWKKPLGLLDVSILNLRVLPNDIDITKISNDRYIALMDLGRMDIGFRVGLRRAMLKKKWGPVVTFQTIRFCDIWGQVLSFAFLLNIWGQSPLKIFGVRVKILYAYH